jgi:hypothetical protein
MERQMGGGKTWFKGLHSAVQKYFLFNLLVPALKRLASKHANKVKRSYHFSEKIFTFVTF